MSTTNPLWDQTYLEMRWRTLSLAADLDRLERASVDLGKIRLDKLRSAMGVLLDNQPDRAARIQMIFSDTTPPPQ